MLLSSLDITSNLDSLPEGKVLINTINAWSFVVAQNDAAFERALEGGDALVPDGQSIVWAARFLKLPNAPAKRIAGWDLFTYEMDRLNRKGGKCFFMGSSEQVLSLIKERANRDYPNVEVVTYSPPFKEQFSAEENDQIISAVNAADPDLLWVGMTAPKQEKWAFEHWDKLNINCHCGTIGAVFDFYAGTARRAPEWMQKAGLEWLHRLCSNPGRMWRRYIVGNAKFINYIVKERFR
jgi:bacterial polymer biosynthesis proteins, WecB/TagA/CpsF family